MKNQSLQEAKKLWAELGDIPIDENELIEIAWRYFSIGTDRMQIWHWFEDYYGISIAKDLMCI